MQNIETILELYRPDVERAAAYVNGEMAVRTLPDHVQRRLREFRKTMECAGCGQRIAEDIQHRVVGIQTFHPSCATRHAARSGTSAPSASKTNVIGTLDGVALVFKEPCGISTRDGAVNHEAFDTGAFDRSISRGGQELRVNHTPGALRGRFTWLGEDRGRLTFVFALEDGPRERGVLDDVEAGRVRGCSIGFRPSGCASRFVGTVEHFADVQLDEISLLTHSQPAWFNTSVRAFRR